MYLFNNRLTDLHTNFLHGENVRVDLAKGGHKIFLQAGAQTVDVPRGKFHNNQLQIQNGPSPTNALRKQAALKQDFAVQCLEFFDVSRLRTAFALDYVERNFLAFVKSFVTVALDGREMHEDIVALFASNESVAFFRAEPLYLTNCHVQIPPMNCIALCAQACHIIDAENFSVNR